MIQNKHHIAANRTSRQAYADQTGKRQTGTQRVTNTHTQTHIEQTGHSPRKKRESKILEDSGMSPLTNNTANSTPERR